MLGHLVRLLVYMLGSIAGLPESILGPFIRLQEALLFRVSYAGGLGKTRKHLRGLPQGDPWSMLMWAITVYSWVVIVQKNRGNSQSPRR